MTSGQALHSGYDVVLWDVDGVLIDGHAVIAEGQHAWAALGDVKAMALVTNNASRTPEQVVETLAAHDIALRPEQVMTSALAAASLVAGQTPDATVLAIGGDGVVDALRHQGLRVIPASDGSPNEPIDVVVQGLGRTVSWEHLAAGARAIHRGATWVVTNNDSTLPTSDGPMPGNGALAAVISTATGAVPVVTGKPHREIFAATLQLPHLPAQARSIMVGDRLETDIEGAHQAGIDSLWVGSGVHTLHDVLAAPAHQRPTYVAPNAAALLQPHGTTHVHIDAEHITVTCHRVTITANASEATVMTDDNNPATRATAWVGLYWALSDANRPTRPAESLTAWATQDWPKATP